MTVLQNAALRKTQLVFGAVAGIQELKSKRLQKKCRALAEREKPFRIMEFTNFLNCGQHHLFVLRNVEGEIPHTGMLPDVKAFSGGVITGKRFIGLIVVDRVEEKILVYQYAHSNWTDRKFEENIRISYDSPVFALKHFTKVNIWFWQRELHILLNKTRCR
ncbi:hypothetical protein [Escherichia coli]|uniref:hypothetical protein n=1 Tax=Escherichia coli TaxID=562 RepID=UPI000DA44413|nr:hypothetical protein [Escherichia coli]EFA8566973.1 hypothetical protein [Escherichia coli O157]EFB2483643.1 hypothetical protein [Escherichia coli]EFH9021668.1 hypothetical protein [Escherichia coli]EFM6410833.1 hypothetical protein [Escherichia coli]EFN5035135.1 hypothetical protein [Escherichia coli]